jgi:hypothetical protein
MKPQYAAEKEIEALVSAFESCSFHPEEFRHYQHLTVALWYVWHHSPVEAKEKVTTGIRRLAETYGKTGYHETITLFWLRMVSHFVAEHKSNSLKTTANALIEEYDNKDLIRQFYSEELLNSPEAKAAWVEPDLKPLPTPTDSQTA